MKLDVFGVKTLEIVRQNDGWRAFYCGEEGKKRLANDIAIPNDLSESEVVEFVADIFHEYATLRHNQVVVL